MPTTLRDGVRIYFADVGDGPPVLLHTGGCGDGRMWERAGYVDALSDRRRLLIDHRGHGRSDLPTSLDEHRLEEYAADVIAVLDEADVEQVALVGYSGGATVVYRVAAAHPDRCVAVVGIGDIPTPDAAPGSVGRAAEVRHVGTRATLEAMAAEETEPPPAWLMDNLTGTQTEMFALMLEAWANAPSSWDDLPHIAAPTLLIAGASEHSAEEMHAALSRLGNGRGVSLPKFGHLQTFWHGEITAPLIAQFLADLRS